MPFVIQPTRSLSLSCLAQLHAQGFYVVKTPHVGNIYPNNLACAAAGIPLLLCDQTFGERDTNFHPHLLIVGGRAEVVARSDRMMTHARITRAPDNFSDRFKVGESAAEAHVRALRDALPQASVETLTEREVRLVDMLMPAYEILTKMQPSSWRRILRTEDGVVIPVSHVPQWKEIESIGIHRLSANGTGWIVPNAWNILLDGLIGSLTSGRNIVYELSGPDMINYWPKHSQEISAGYDLLRKELWPQLPETLTLCIIPVAEMRLVCSEGRRGLLDAVVDSYLRILGERTTSGEVLRTAPQEQRSAVITQLQATRKRLYEETREAVRNCPEIFYEIKQANFFTQYDLLRGEILAIHPWGIEQPIDTIEQMMTMLRRMAS
jgi:hypothetical protein